MGSVITGTGLASRQQDVDERAPGLVHGAGDRRQRRGTEVGAEDVVVPDHADPCRHRDAPLAQPAEHADGQEVVEGDERGRARGQADVGGGRTAVEGGRERAAADDPWRRPPRRARTGRAIVRRPTRRRSARRGRPGTGGPRATRCSTICRLPSAESVARLASPSTRRLNSTTGRRPARACSSASGSRLAASTKPSTEEAEPVQVGRLQFGAGLRVGDHERGTRGARLRLGAADQSEVVRVGDVGHQHRQHPRPPGGQRLGEPVGPVPHLPGDRLHVLPRPHVDALGIGQRAGHGRDGDARLPGDVLQRHRPASRRTAVSAHRHPFVTQDTRRPSGNYWQTFAIVGR